MPDARRTEVAPGESPDVFSRVLRDQVIRAAVPTRSCRHNHITAAKHPSRESTAHREKPRFFLLFSTNLRGIYERGLFENPVQKRVGLSQETPNLFRVSGGESRPIPVHT
jgi:hypothetical protein